MPSSLLRCNSGDTHRISHSAGQWLRPINMGGRSIIELIQSMSTRITKMNNRTKSDGITKTGLCGRNESLGVRIFIGSGGSALDPPYAEPMPTWERKEAPTYEAYET